MSKVIFIVLGIWSCCCAVKAQVVVVNPTMPTDGKTVEIFFDATQGTKGLIGYTGDVYAHTGVITDKSSSDSDWKYVKVGWNVNIDACKLTRTGTNSYKFSLTPSIREFYGVPASEKILKVALVFRSSDGSKEGKDTGSKDILVDVYESGLNVSFDKPSSVYSVVNSGVQIPISVNALNSNKIDLYLDQQLLTTTSATSLTYALLTPVSGKYMLRAVASSGSSEIADTCWFVVHESPTIETRPVGLRRGVNRVNDQTATFLIYAPDKEYIYLAGDFNNWMPGSDHQMKKDGNYFWLTVSGLSPNKEYAYQYWIDNSLQLADPYSNKILDPSNDKYISSTIYPNLMAYPTGKATDLISVFTTNSASYSWQVSSFATPKADTMVVYELLIRDFTANKDIKTVTDTLSYLKRLGVNAIELMPFNEFEGNDSWGYNPSFYFAPDKAYGTINDYKAFVDACHQQGIAVIQDMVLNHSFGQSPFVRMYFDGSKPTSNNPWYNVNHNMLNPNAQWGYDFNHESLETQALVDSVCSFWMSEFKIDGFRFDFTKGFTNTVYGTSDWGSAYDASRIKILKRMFDQIRKRKSDAIVIFEHLADNSEEKVLANYGILLWGNHNYNFSEGAMGFNDQFKSDFSWISYKNRGWDKASIVNYMESHDEERLMYQNLMYGNSSTTYNVRERSTALKRMELTGAFLFLVPGPKMIWQFGELGYDVSINFGGRTSSKPLHWEYQADSSRMAVYNRWSKLIQLKKQEAIFSSADFSIDVSGAIKKVALNHVSGNVLLIGNFDVRSSTNLVVFNGEGKWYDYFNGDSINVTNSAQLIALNAGEFRLFSQKKLVGFDDYVVPPVVEKNTKCFALPNPCRQELIISNPFEGEATLEIFNLCGAKLFQYQFMTEQVSISPDVSGWMNGLFILRIKSKSGKEAFQKLLKY